MRKIGLALATVGALATAAVTMSPAEARGGRNAAIGFGLAAGALGAAAIANSAYNNGYYGRATATTVADRFIMMMDRATTDRAIIVITTIGNVNHEEEARAVPGLFSCLVGGPAGSARQCRDKAFEQGHQPLTGHPYGGDDGESNKAGDEAVFDCGRTALVAQEFAEHEMPLRFHKSGMASTGCYR